MVVEPGDIGAAFAAKQPYLAMDVRLVFFRGKAAVNILQIPGGNNDIIGNFNKIFAVAALRTHYPPCWFTAWNFNLCHKIFFTRTSRGC